MTRKYKIRAPAESVSGESLLPGSELATFSLPPHLVSGVRESSGVSFMRALILFMTYSPLKAPSITITLGFRFQHTNFGGTLTFSAQHPECQAEGATSVLWSMWPQTPNTSYTVGADGLYAGYTDILYQVQGGSDATLEHKPDLMRVS